MASGTLTLDASIGQHFKMTAPVTTTAMSLACWVYPTSNITSSPISILDTGDGFVYHAIYLIASGAVRAQSGVNPTAAFAATSSNWTLNAWNHLLAVFNSATDRRIYLNGGSKGTDATSKSPASLDTLSVGSSSTGVATFAYGAFFTGQLKEAAVWNVSLTDADATSLNGGASPSSIAGLQWQLSTVISGGGGGVLIPNGFNGGFRG